MTDSDDPGQGATNDHDGDLRIFLRFRGRGYDLKQFTQMIEGIEALIVLLLADSEGLDFEMGANNERTLDEASVEKWYTKQRSITAERIDVGEVRLISPLEVVLYVAATSSLLAAMIRQWMNVRDKHNESRKRAAKASRDKTESELEQLAHKFLGEVISGKISPDTAKKILKDPTIRKAIKRATKPMKHLEKVRADRVDDSER